jgi:transposase InsO family protein
VLVELGLVEQRYAAVKDVLDNGASVTDVARRNGVSRSAVHEWLVKYAKHGLAGLVDKTSRPASCPHQMDVLVEARIVELRREHPGWGPRTLEHRIRNEGFEPVPGRTSIYRCLVRHGLITPEARKRKRADYKRWERSQSMELWQMDIVGGVRLVDGSEAKIVTGVDDHSRFCVSAFVVARATARPTCDALALAMRTHGIPEAILTDNGKVFTGRFGKGPGIVLFDRICRENGIKHLLTAPRSPTTTGKVERFHKTLRREFLNGKVFTDLADAQTQLDGWVREYNFDRPHQSLGMAVPWDRFRLAMTDTVADVAVDSSAEESIELGVSRRVGGSGLVSFAGASYLAGRWLAGESVTVVCDRGLVHLQHRGALIATHSAAPGREGTRRRAPQAEGPKATRHRQRGRGDPEGRLERHGVLRRHQLRRRVEVPASAGPDRRRRRHRRDQPQRPGSPNASGSARPRQGARRLRHPRRPASTNQRRLTSRRAAAGRRPR